MKFNQYIHSRNEGSGSASILLLSVFLMMALFATACSKDDGDNGGSNKKMFMHVNKCMMYKEPLKVMLYDASGSKNIDYTVDYGDGNTGSGKSSTLHKYVYAAPGTYKVKVTQGGNIYEEDVTVYSLPALTEAMKQFKQAGNKTVWAMTHRSHTADKSIPENSVKAVEAAIAAKADVIECDTHRTKDGVVVICHDQTIDATTNGSGDITQMTYSELMQYNLTDREGRTTAEKMPTLEEFLKAGKGKVYFNLDYSPRSASTKEVMDIVKNLEMMEQVFFYCNSAQKTSEVLAHTPDAQVYTWGQGAYSPLVGREGNYFVQYTYSPNGDSTPIGTSERDGMITTANLLHVLNNSIPEFDINTTQLNDLLNVYPNIHMIQTDVPEKLIPLLRSKGLHE